MLNCIRLPNANIWTLRPYDILSLNAHFWTIKHIINIFLLKPDEKCCTIEYKRKNIYPGRWVQIRDTFNITTFGNRRQQLFIQWRQLCGLEKCYCHMRQLMWLNELHTGIWLACMERLIFQVTFNCGEKWQICRPAHQRVVIDQT